MVADWKRGLVHVYDFSILCALKKSHLPGFISQGVNLYSLLIFTKI